MIEIHTELFRAAMTVLIGGVAWAVVRLINKVDRLDKVLTKIQLILAGMGKSTKDVSND